MMADRCCLCGKKASAGAEIRDGGCGTAVQLLCSAAWAHGRRLTFPIKPRFRRDGHRMPQPLLVGRTACPDHPDVRGTFRVLRQMSSACSKIRFSVRFRYHVSPDGMPIPSEFLRLLV
jgi:hypothetical protein